jgi:hypothetical protein
MTPVFSIVNLTLISIRHTLKLTHEIVFIITRLAVTYLLHNTNFMASRLRSYLTEQLAPFTEPPYVVALTIFIRILFYLVIKKIVSNSPSL